jgi:hypothetical protein
MRAWSHPVEFSREFSRFLGHCRALEMALWEVFSGPGVFRWRCLVCKGGVRWTAVHLSKIATGPRLAQSSGEVERWQAKAARRTVRC